jgi:hypothetical protein
VLIDFLGTKVNLFSSAVSATVWGWVTSR